MYYYLKESAKMGLGDINESVSDMALDASDCNGNENCSYIFVSNVTHRKIANSLLSVMNLNNIPRTTLST